MLVSSYSSEVMLIVLRARGRGKGAAKSDELRSGACENWSLDARYRTWSRDSADIDRIGGLQKAGSSRACVIKR